MKNCNCDSEINRDGSGQLQRYLKALDPAYAPIDDRSTEDLLVFAKRYAAQIRFYDIPESKINDGIPAKKVSWREFFRRDMAVIAASIAVTEAEGFKKEYDEVNERLQINTKPEIYAALYAPIIGMIKKIDRWYSVAIPENPLYADLKLAIDSDLKQQVQKIMAYEEGFKFVDPTVDLKIDLNGIENKDAWGLNETVSPDATIYKGTTREEKILNASLFTEDIFHAFYNFLNRLISDSEKYFLFALEEYPAHQPHMALFITFLQLFNRAQTQMNGLTGRLLDFYYKEVLHLETKPSVPDKAHIVFELAKDVTEYPIATGTALKGGSDKSGKEQLYKTTSDLVVNQAKVKELKTIFVEKIEKETDAGSEMIDTIYARPVANSSDGFGAKFEDDDTKWPTFGVGSPDKTKPKNTCEKIEQLKEAIKRKDQTRVGFAIASPQLLMQGGKRLIEVKLNATAAALFEKQEQMTLASKGNLFEIWFTGETEWFKVDTVMTAADQVKFKRFLPAGIFSPLTDDFEASYYLTEEKIVGSSETSYILSVYLPSSVQAVIEYSTKLHTAYTYSTAQPVMQLLLNPVLDLKPTDYKNFSVDKLSLKVKVGSIFPKNEENRTPQDIFKILGIDSAEAAAFVNFTADGLSKLVLQNETQGVLPAGKPFDPFTAYPNKGKSFYIGSNEVFNKPLGKLAVFIKKTMEGDNKTGAAGFVSTGKTAEYDVSILESRRWNDLIPEKGNDFFQETLKSNILNQSFTSNGGLTWEVKPHIHLRKPLLPVTEWKPGTEKGFIRLTNLIPVSVGNNITMSFLQASQNMAPAFEIKEVSVSYVSDLTELEVGVDAFYHIYPFGTIETYVGAASQINGGAAENIRNTITKIRASLSNNQFAKADEQKDYLLVNADKLLLPQFTYIWPYEQYKPPAAPAANLTLGKEGNIIRKISAREEGDAYAEKLILSASGLQDKISGGDNQYSGETQEEGLLFIGIEKTQPLQMVSMLFQFADGSAADEDNDPPEIHWSYLTNNEWRPMKEENLVSDGTAGFQTTGIIKIEIPEDATNNNTIITSGLYWLCASVTTDSNRIPMLIDVVTQAVLANFEDNNNDQSHFDAALPAGSISKLSVAVSQIGKVQQPFASYDGKHQEIGKEFYTRVSERLRHKARAITPWDYEHLVLDRFPSVYKVKCITHTDPNCLCTEKEVTINPDSTVLVKYNATGGFDSSEEVKIKAVLNQPKTLKVVITVFSPLGNTALATVTGNQLKARFIAAGFTDANIIINIVTNGEPFTIEIKLSGNSSIEKSCCGPQIAPGHVLLIPISNLKNRNAVNQLQPKTSRRVLLDIEAYIKKRTSSFVHVHAKNPVYEQVLVFFRVKFRDGYDKGYYMKELNKEIVHFLTPWAFDDIAEVKFGQKIYASSIINFIEERAYVDFITDFLMIVCRSGCCDDVAKAVINSNDDKDVLNRISDCSDMEILLQDNPDFIGDIVAKPSTARSLLVSAPQHIIIPYQEPEVLSPCQKPKPSLMDKSKLSKLIETGIKPVVEIKPVPLPAVESVTEVAVAVPAPVVNPIKDVAVAVPASVVNPIKDVAVAVPASVVNPIKDVAVAVPASVVNPIKDVAVAVPASVVNPIKDVAVAVPASVVNPIKDVAVAVPAPVVNPIKDVAIPVPVAVVTDSIKSADIQKPVKEPAVKKAPAKTVKKNTKAPKKK
jgi:hypothetical protein